MGPLFSLALAASAARPALAQRYVYITVDVPGAAATIPTGINNAGAICGNYQTPPSGATHGFILDQAGRLTKFDAPGAGFTYVSDMNDAGAVSGWWSPDLTGNVETGFLRNAAGVLTSITAADAADTNPVAVNDAGEMAVTTLTEPGPAKAWFVDAAGNYNAITIAGGTPPYPQALNNNGLIVGSTTVAAYDQRAFLYDAATGASQTFQVPGATVSTVAYAVNDAGEIAGSYTLGYRGGESSHGFVRLAEGRIIHIDYPGSISTTVRGINAGGDLTGTYDDAQGTPHGFMALKIRAAILREKRGRARQATPQTLR